MRCCHLFLFTLFLAGLEPSSLATPPPLPEVPQCSGTAPRETYLRPRFTAFVCTEQQEPQSLPGGWKRGPGLVIQRRFALDRLQLPETVVATPPGGPPLQYRFVESRLEIIRYAYDPRFREDRPWVQYVLDLEELKPQPRQVVLLAERPNDTRDLNRILRALAQPKTGFPPPGLELPPTSTREPTPIAALLLRVRNMGLTDPASLHARLARYQSAWWCEGPNAAVLAEVQEELALAALAQKTTR